MKRLLLTAMVLLLLTGCGPSEAELQATAVVVEAEQTAAVMVQEAALQGRQQALEAALQATARAAEAAAVATATADPCSPDRLRAYGGLIERELEIYEGLLSIAASTSRIALAGTRQELQERRFVVKDIEAPECLAMYHTRVLEMIEKHELGYSSFTSNTSDVGDFTTFFIFRDASDRLERVKDSLKTILDGRRPVSLNYLDG